MRKNYGGLAGLALIVILVVTWFNSMLTRLDQLPEFHGLPHRPLNELTNWGQGRAPEPSHCPPGTIRLDTDDGLFLECLRGTN